ncbi:MAG: hypothetical protein LBT70_02650 [Holosporaceae bacterium]|nr:hypothetical protein [Holosporaceae bacterium]
MHNGFFLQDPSVLVVHEDLSNEFDEVDGEKKPLGNGLDDSVCGRSSAG